MLKNLVVILSLAATPLAAQERAFTLDAPDTLVESGFLKHLLPRFSLKTGIRITLGEGAAAFGAEGTPVFRRDAKIWHFFGDGGAQAAAFEDWLLSEVGKRTIDQFKPESGAPFRSDVAVQAKAEMVELTGDLALGEKISLAHCGRCHVINDSNRMNAIGSSPSFALMRTFSDWQRRFRTFFALKPHPAFTQVTDVTEPFADNLPSPIAPVEVTLEEIEAIMAYVGSIQPADLGSPIQFQ